jgi:methionine-rich copper-binding protein CopC
MKTFKVEISKREGLQTQSTKRGTKRKKIMHIAVETMLQRGNWRILLTSACQCTGNQEKKQ